MPRKVDKPRRKAGARPQPPSASGAPPRGWQRKRWAAVAAVVLLLGICTWYWAAGETATAAFASPQRAQRSSAFMQIPAMAAGQSISTAAQPQRQELNNRLEAVDQTLCNYRESTKYPISSRPAAEHLDQLYPNRPIQQSQAMHTAQGGTDVNIRVQTSQSRVYLAAGESAVFSIGATDKEGKPLSVFVTQAVAHGLTFQPSRPAPQAALQFADDGKNGDVQASDGTFTAMLTPAQTGFAQFNGTIRTEVSYNVGDRNGVVSFDVIHSPEYPATWNGSARESVEDGTLVFRLKLDVRMPGRYIATGRVDDANGKPFALATFNDLLQQGSNEIRLTVFGKLLRDETPAMPLKLRDVEAYLLKEDVDPDRALLPRLEGTVLVSKAYSMKGFSDAEWQSEERTRHLTEFGKDVELAKKALVELDPEQARRPFPQSECTRKLAAHGKGA